MSLEKLTALLSQEELNPVFLAALISGQNSITRFTDFEYFTVPFEGDEVLVRDDLRASFEQAIGSPLIEEPAIGFRSKPGRPTLVRLTAPAQAVESMRLALNASTANSRSQKLSISGTKSQYTERK